MYDRAQHVQNERSQDEALRIPCDGVIRLFHHLAIRIHQESSVNQTRNMRKVNV